MIGRIGSVGILGLGGGRRLLYPRHVQEFLDRRTAADVTAGFTTGLERGVTDAFSTCIEALVAAGYLGISGGILAQAASVIKAGVPMLGAGTLSGALIPWAGDMPTPTNVNFVPGDYSRRTGLVGNGSTKTLGTGRNNNADPQNSKHLGVYVTAIGSGSTIYMGAPGYGTSGHSTIAGDLLAGRTNTAVNRAASYFPRIAAPAPGFVFANRSGASAEDLRVNGTALSGTGASATPLSNEVFVFSAGTTGTPLYTNARIAYYSIGEGLALALYDSIITTLATSISAAIP